MGTNPYRDLEDYRFWSRAVAWPAPGQLDPVIVGTRIGPQERIVTMGSCFAQHLARNLGGLGLNHFVAEPPPPGMAADEAQRRNYGLFSARYGNLYTVRQALQLFERAFGRFQPADAVWKSADGFVDAFRPQMEPDPLPSPEAVLDRATQHLGHVRTMFESAEWLIFTLGLTEGWRSRRDGAVYPVAPGVAAGSFDPAAYEFVNFTVDEVKQDLSRLIENIQAVNAGCRIILTVSPVPLIATYENRHVLTSTVYSKSVLRVAAEEVQRAHGHVTYFPSYEIITSPAAGNSYFADDMRSVTEIGVKHVMRVFKNHFVAGGQRTGLAPATSVPAKAAADDRAAPTEVICDEDLIEASVAVGRLPASGTAGEARRQPEPVAAGPQRPSRADTPSTPAWEVISGRAATTHPPPPPTPQGGPRGLLARLFGLR